MWASGHNGDIRRAAQGYEATREAAMEAFAKSWRRQWARPAIGEARRRDQKALDHHVSDRDQEVVEEALCHLPDRRVFEHGRCQETAPRRRGRQRRDDADQRAQQPDIDQRSRAPFRPRQCRCAFIDRRPRRSGRAPGGARRRGEGSGQSGPATTGGQSRQ